MLLSIVIPVKNDAVNLALCLESVKEFDDVIVVDSGSTDNTSQVAEKFSRQVIYFKWDGKFPKKRNWTLRTQTFKHPWVLFLDADERVTPGFRAEVQRTLLNTSYDAFWIGYQNWFLNAQLRYGDPMRKLALLRVGHGEYEEIFEDHWSSLDMEILEQLMVDGTAGVIHSPLEHHDKRDLHAYYARHNDYASWEANRYLVLKDSKKLTTRQRLKYCMLIWPIFPVLYFLGSYVWKCGFLDGRAGFLFAIGKMSYFYQVQAKILELKEKR